MDPRGLTEQQNSVLLKTIGDHHGRWDEAMEAEKEVWVPCWKRNNLWAWEPTIPHLFS